MCGERERERFPFVEKYDAAQRFVESVRFFVCGCFEGYIRSRWDGQRVAMGREGMGYKKIWKGVKGW